MAKSLASAATSWCKKAAVRGGTPAPAIRPRGCTHSNWHALSGCGMSRSESRAYLTSMGASDLSWACSQGRRSGGNRGSDSMHLSLHLSSGKCSGATEDGMEIECCLRLSRAASWQDTDAQNTSLPFCFARTCRDAKLRPSLKRST